MISLTIDDLVTPLTEAQILEKFLTNLERSGLKPRSWREGGVYRTILRIVAGTFASFSDLQAQFIKSGFLELAEGNWLTWVAFYVYGVERPESKFATGTVTLTNSGGGNYTFAAGQIRVFNTVLKKAFTNQVAFTLAPLSSVSTSVSAVESGAASSSAASTIDAIETTYLGQITVTNAAPVVGSDALPDVDLRQLCKDKRDARSVFGPRGAYAYAIRSAKRLDGSAVDINRLSISPSSSTGRVTAFVASPSGAPTAPDVTAVRASIESLSRPDTVTVTTSPAVEVLVTRVLTLWAEKQPGLTAADLRALALTQILLLNRAYPIGGIRKNTLQGYFYADKLEGTVHKAHPAIYDVDGVGADVALAQGEVAVLAVTIGAVNIVDTEVH